MDIFVPAGSDVFAPLDGTVHSFRDNAARLDYGPTIILEHAPASGVRFFTLYGHLSRASLAGLEPGQTVRKGERLGAVGAIDENGGWPPHLHFQVIADMLGKSGDFPGVAPHGRRDLWTALSPDPNAILGVSDELLRDTALEPAEIAALRREHLGRSLSLSYRSPLTIVRGSMQNLIDRAGRVFLDAVNNVPHVGHSHPKVVEAVRRQAAVLNTNTRYLHETIVRYARRLAALLPDPLEVCFFVNSGSEANDLALRLAAAYTGRRDIVVLDGAYHGNLSSLIAISPYKFNGPGGAGCPPATHVAPMPDPYRGLFRDDPRAGEKYAARVGDIFKELAAAGRPPAAFIAEPVLSCAGQIVPPPGFLEEAFRLVREAGGVAIADEVQVGFGRCGTHFWAFETQGAGPDILTLGKPIGNGHPLGAVVTTRAIADVFAGGMEYFNTFGGNPVSCAAGMAVLDVVEEEGLQANALTTGARLSAGLRSLMDRHPLIGDVRGLGLFLGVELVLDRATREPAPLHAAYAVERMREEGVLLSTDGPDRNVLKIKPPLCFTAADADLLVAKLDRVLSETPLTERPRARPPVD
jgi:4-aminobutyrate aminotransferase-like enzyme